MLLLFYIAIALISLLWIILKVCHAFNCSLSVYVTHIVRLFSLSRKTKFLLACVQIMLPLCNPASCLTLNIWKHSSGVIVQELPDEIKLNFHHLHLQEQYFHAGVFIFPALKLQTTCNGPLCSKLTDTYALALSWNLTQLSKT